MSAIAVAVRNRKEDFKRLIINFIEKRKGRNLRIMSLASGSCRDIYELFLLYPDICKNVTFDCYDNDYRAIEFAKSLIKNNHNVRFFNENAVRIALKKDISAIISNKYDLIYCTGLFDYFSDKIALCLIQNLKKILKKEGALAISNVRDKYSNPSLHFMEWAGDWNLVYRDGEEFKTLFINGGFKETDFETYYEQQGIMQYIITNKNSIY